MAGDQPYLLMGLTFAVALYSYGLFYSVLFTLPIALYLGLQAVAPQLLPKGQAPDAADSDAA